MLTFLMVPDLCGFLSLIHKYAKLCLVYSLHSSAAFNGSTSRNQKSKPLAKSEIKHHMELVCTNFFSSFSCPKFWPCRGTRNQRSNQRGNGQGTGSKKELTGSLIARLVWHEGPPPPQRSIIACFHRSAAGQLGDVLMTLKPDKGAAPDAAKRHCTSARTRVWHADTHHQAEKATAMTRVW